MVFKKNFQKFGTPQNGPSKILYSSPKVGKCFVAPHPPPLPSKKKTQRKIILNNTMNYGQVQPSECFYVNFGAKLAHPEV